MGQIKNLYHPKVQMAAEMLKAAMENGTPCEPVRNLIGDTDVEMAYAVQMLNNMYRASGGDKVCGQKIGLTSFAVQKQLGVDKPDYGWLFNSMNVPNGGEVPWAECMQAKAEAEVAFVLKKDITNAYPSEQDILDATEYICAAIEVVGSRIQNWDIRITDTISDNAAASHFVLGTQKVDPAGFDYIGCGMQMWKNGELCSEGKGEACLGSPVKAVQWLAKNAVALEMPLRAGDIILSGALGPMTNASPGDHFKATVDGLGDVEVRFSKD